MPAFPAGRPRGSRKGGRRTGGFAFPAVLLGLLSLLAHAVPALAQDACPLRVGQLLSVEGEVLVQEASGWRPAALGASLCQDQTVRTGARSRAAISLVNGSVLRLDEATTLRLADVAAEESGRSVLDLLLGAVQVFSRRPREVDVRAPHMVLAIRGTEFLVRADGGQSLVAVQEGAVLASNQAGELAVSAGQSALARPGEAPQPYLLVRPRDAVQWALHYPPILSFAAAGEDPALGEAAALARAGDATGALAALDRLPEAAAREPRAQLLRAALLLEVGRVEEARGAIERSLAADPSSALARALLAVIDVAQNRPDEALANAERAVALDPRSAPARIALSYAQQARFDLEGARDSLLAAVADNPDDPLAWARLAEVWQMLGQGNRAREAAERAAALAPDLGRVQTVRGFADLTSFRTKPARAAFERAIALDSADPLPRFGLGLAQVRGGDLSAGRANIEAAVGLDPNNALLRAYLGKAYFEEIRDDLAAQQYGIAKELDPLDPTPYLYDAILKQTANRPVEALRELEESIARNDNRAVYRSRLALDQDRAARGTSLARVYQDLGFLDIGGNEAAKSLALDPGNAAAHRFLSDLYAGERRREIARVSELLQAQLLQDVNLNPVQPSLSEANLNLVTRGGPAAAGFNEFTPLFERNRTQLNASGVVGNQETLGGEAVVSAVHDGISVSAGAFGYETDGFRDNNDFEHEIYNVYFQAAVTPKLNAQLEYRHRDSSEGDLAFNFDPDDFLRDRERTLDQDILRLGLRYAPAPGSDFLLSVIGSDRNEEIEQAEPFGPFEVATGASADDEAIQVEGQHLWRRDRFNLTSGLAYTDVDRELDTRIAFDGFPFVDEQDVPEDIHHARGYVYGNLRLPQPVTWTLGLSLDDYEEEALDERKLNPKLGAQWQVTDDLLLRAAAFRVVKPALVANRTIEPTQVAGFNQLFDDINATSSWRYGLGADWRLRPGLYLGAEATWRYLDEPVFVDDDVRFEDREEQLHRVYLNWAPLPRWAFTAELAYDRYESEEGIVTEFDDLPEKVETVSLPLGARYFDPSGFFAGLGLAYVHQEVRRSPNAAAADGTDDFFLVDASLGYRFPNRRGFASLEVRNLFDNGFQYQDDSFREFRDEPSIGPYIPERQIRLRVTLNF